MPVRIKHGKKTEATNITTTLNNIENKFRKRNEFWTTNASRYRTRKESKGKHNRDNAKDEQLMVMHIDHNDIYYSKANAAGYRFRKVKLGRLFGGGCSELGVFVTRYPKSGPLGDALMVKVDTVKWKVGTVCPYLWKLFRQGSNPFPRHARL